MAANVRCTNANVWRDGALRTCGWKGERFAVGQRIGVPYFRWDNEDRVARTRRPCPRCGGRVELIPGGDPLGR
jgi:hypothetical protein